MRLPAAYPAQQKRTQPTRLTNPASVVLHLAEQQLKQKPQIHAHTKLQLELQIRVRQHAAVCRCSAGCRQLVCALACYWVTGMLFSLRKRDPLTFVQHNPCNPCIQPTAHATVHADNNACSHAYSHQPMQPMHSAASPCNRACRQQSMHTTYAANNP